MRDDFPGITRKVQEQVELFGSQVNSSAIHRHAMRCRVYDEIAGLDCDIGIAVWRAPQMRAYTSQQLLRAEGLGHIVICACIERFNLRPLLIANGKHQNGNVALCANRA